MTNKSKILFISILIYSPCCMVTLIYGINERSLQMGINSVKFCGVFNSHKNSCILVANVRSLFLFSPAPRLTRNRLLRLQFFLIGHIGNVIRQRLEVVEPRVKGPFLAIVEQLHGRISGDLQPKFSTVSTKSCHICIRLLI